MSRNPINFTTLGEDPFGPAVAARYAPGLVGQGISAELIASQWSLGRDELDDFAARSHRLAAASDFSREIVELDGGTVDETIREGTTVEKLGGLSPAFRDEDIARHFPEIDWRITTGNSAPLTDSASAVLIMSEEKAALLGPTPRARFRSFAVTGSDPVEMLTRVIAVTERLLARSGLGIDDIDVFEVDEALSSVPLAWMHDLHADPDRVNPKGGAIALGHPLGASGTRLLMTMLGALEESGGRFGLQTMCEGGGMGQRHDRGATLMEIAGTVALVTGGASGLGLATATALGAEGASVVIVDLPTSVGEATAADRGFTFVAADVSDGDEVQTAVETATALGPRRMLGNCAGIGSPGRAVGRDGPLSLDSFERVIRVTLIGTFNVIRLAGAAMAHTEPVGEDRGVIISTATVRPSTVRSARPPTRPPGQVSPR